MTHMKSIMFAICANNTRRERERGGGEGRGAISMPVGVECVAVAF